MLGWLVIGMIAATAGCGGTMGQVNSADCVMLVPGISGDGFWYDGLRRGIGAGAPQVAVQTVNWGVPLPLFMLNTQTSMIHRDAEKKLVKRIHEWQEKRPGGTICLVGHSAGAGVILGALEKLDAGVQVERVVLLSPAVSPGYPLEAALSHVRDSMHVFYSDGDTFWLGWSARNFGAYDRKKEESAGKVGFRLLCDAMTKKVVQHAYEPAWKPLGHDGGHFGCTRQAFAEQVLGPLVRGEPPIDIDTDARFR